MSTNNDPRFIIASPGNSGNSGFGVQDMSPPDDSSSAAPQKPASGQVLFANIDTSFATPLKKKITANKTTLATTVSAQNNPFNGALSSTLSNTVPNDVQPPQANPFSDVLSSSISNTVPNDVQTTQTAQTQADATANFVALQQQYANLPNGPAPIFVVTGSNVDGNGAADGYYHTITKNMAGSVISDQRESLIAGNPTKPITTAVKTGGTVTTSTPVTPAINTPGNSERTDAIKNLFIADMGREARADEISTWGASSLTMDQLKKQVDSNPDALGAMDRKTAIKAIFDNQMGRDPREDEYAAYMNNGQTVGDLSKSVQGFGDTLAHGGPGGTLTLNDPATKPTASAGDTSSKVAQSSGAVVSTSPPQERVSAIQAVFKAEMDRDARPDEIAAYGGSSTPIDQIKAIVAAYPDSLNAKASDTSIQNIFHSEMDRDARADELDAYKASGMTGTQLRDRVRTYPDSIAVTSKAPDSGGFQATQGPNPPQTHIPDAITVDAKALELSKGLVTAVGPAAEAPTIPVNTPGSIVAPNPVSAHNAQVQDTFHLIMGRDARPDELAAFANMSTDSIKAQISTYPDSIANSANTKVDSMTINAIFNSEMGRGARQDELDAYNAAGMTNQQLKDRVNAFSDSLQSQAASAARIDTGFPPSQNNAATLALGGSAPGQSGPTNAPKYP